MDENVTAVQVYRGLIQSMTIVLAGIFALIFFQQGWPLLIMGPGSIYESGSPVLVLIGIGLALPFLLYGTWRMLPYVWGANAKILRAARTNAAFRDEVKRYRKNLIPYMLLATVPALALYLYRYPPLEFYGWALAFALMLGALGGVLASSISYLVTNRPPSDGHSAADLPDPN